MKKSILLLNTVILVLSWINILSQESQYRIANRYHVEGEGFWDAISVDDQSGRLFISHGTEVNVLDANSGVQLGTIPDTKGVHDIAIANDLNLGFTTNGRDTSVTVFDLTTYNIISVVKVTGLNPDAILYDQFSHNVFTFNGGTSNATVIDAKLMKVLGTIPLEGKPEFAVTDGKGKIYVNIEDKNLLDEIDPVNMKVMHSWSVAPGNEPSGLAIDNLNHRLFSVCGNKLMVIIDATDGHVITTLPIGEHVDGAAFDKELRRVYSSNGEGTLTVVQEVDKDNFNVLENVVTQRSARTCVVYQKNHHIYLPAAEFNPPPDATPDNPHPRPTIISGTFVILDVEPK